MILGIVTADRDQFKRFIHANNGGILEFVWIADREDFIHYKVDGYIKVSGWTHVDSKVNGAIHARNEILRASKQKPSEASKTQMEHAIDMFTRSIYACGVSAKDAGEALSRASTMVDRRMLDGMIKSKPYNTRVFTPRPFTWDGVSDVDLGLDIEGNIEEQSDNLAEFSKKQFTSLSNDNDTQKDNSE